MRSGANNVIILQSKLTMPRLKNTIARKRLFPLFDNIQNNKLMTVTAGAGYGKIMKMKSSICCDI